MQSDTLVTLLEAECYQSPQRATICANHKVGFASYVLKSIYSTMANSVLYFFPFP